jgi:putative membrane protein
MYLYLKSLHVIFVVCWFAGLFYIVRLFVYYAEAQLKSELERNILVNQYKIMVTRLWNIITFPAAILSTLFGVLMLIENPILLKMPWMHVKLLFVVLLWLYHFRCHQFVKQIQKETLTKSGNFFRIWNEGATIILFAVVFLVVLKSAINWIYGVIGIVGFAILLMLGIKFYKSIREKNQSSQHNL